MTARTTDDPPPDSSQETTRALRMATFRLARRLRTQRATLAEAAAIMREVADR